LDRFFNPLLAEAGGGEIELLGKETHAGALESGVLLVTGARLWNAMHSELWRHREIAAKAFATFLATEPPLPKYQTSEGSALLFQSALAIAKICAEDKLLQIYFIGLAILKRAMHPSICSQSISHRTVKHAITPFVNVLFEKVQALNYRAREISMTSLMQLFKHPAIPSSMLVDKIITCYDKGPKPDQASWRGILGHLEIFNALLEEIGLSNQWKYKDFMDRILIPSLSNGSADVRGASINSIVKLNQLVGNNQIRNTMQGLNLKPNIKQNILNRCDGSDGKQRKASNSPHKQHDHHKVGYNLPNAQLSAEE
jgi:hypothetical protein